MRAAGVVLAAALLLAAGPVRLGAGAESSGAVALQGARPDPASTMTLRIGIAGPGGYVVRAIPLEEYVAGVVAGEAARNSSPSALEALAITVRTFALANLNRHRADGFDLCDLTHCQVLRKATHATEAAASGTAGKVLLYRGLLASVFYTASCGGRTEQPSHVWPGASDPEYLPSRDDDACAGTPVWSDELSVADLIRSLKAAGFKGDTIRGLRVLTRNESGRVARLRLMGLVPDEISGQDLRVAVGRTLGWQHLKSTTFDVRRTDAGYRFSGRGSGHGVGLCVIGSARLATQGLRASEILARYFPATTIAPLPWSIVAGTEPKSAAPAAVASDEPRIGPEAPLASLPLVLQRPSASAAVRDEVLLSLPSGDEGERDVLHDLVLRERNGLAKDLGTVRPSRITLRLHATVESYQRATGQPWYTAGTTLGTDIHLVPLTVLRERGLLERTIRQELVHLLTRSALSSRPLWVQDGVAAYFAERPVPGEAARRVVVPGIRMSCPDDRELAQPASPGALSNAYVRAAACVGRQIAAGKKWSDIR